MAKGLIRDLIVRLKAVKEVQGLTIQNIMDTLEDNGQHLSQKTIVKVFGQGSEEKEFQPDTIRSIADVILKVYEESPDDDPEIKGLKSEIKLQHRQLELLERELEETKESAARRIEFLRDRVEKQDIRIEQKDRLITLMLMMHLKGADISPEYENGIKQYFNETVDEINEYLIEKKRPPHTAGDKPRGEE